MTFRRDFAVARFPCVEVCYFGRASFVGKVLAAYRTVVIIFKSFLFAGRRFSVNLYRSMTFRRDFAVARFPCVEIRYFVISVFVRKIFAASANVILFNSVFGTSRIDRFDLR